MSKFSKTPHVWAILGLIFVIALTAECSGQPLKIEARMEFVLTAAGR